MLNHQRTLRAGRIHGKCPHAGRLLAVAALTGILAGCGVSLPSGSTEEESAEPAPTASRPVKEREREPPEESQAPAPGGPGIIATPAAAGGVVVGDPFDTGRPAQGTVTAGPNGPGPAAPPRKPFGVGAKERLAEREDDDEDGDGSGQVGNPRVSPLTRPNVASPGGSGKSAGPFRGRLGRPVDRGIADTDEPFNPNQAVPGAATAVIPGTNANVPGLLRRQGGLGADKGGDDDGAGVRAAAVRDANGQIVINRDSADDVAASFLDLLAAGDMERAKTLIASNARGLLVKLRDDKLTAEAVQELQAVAASRQEINSRPKGGRNMQYTYRADPKMILLEARQKEGDSSVVKMELRKAPRQRR